MPKLVFAPPTAQTPGFLRRAKKALEFQRQLQGDATPQLLDGMVEFLLPYVEQPEDRDAAREALWDASQEQFSELLIAVAGGSKNS